MTFSYKKMIEKQKIKDAEKKKKFIDKCDKLLEDLEKLYNKFSNMESANNLNNDIKEEKVKEKVINNINTDKDNKTDTNIKPNSAKVTIKEPKKDSKKIDNKQKSSKCKIISFEDTKVKEDDKLKKSVSNKPVNIPKSSVLIDQIKFSNVMKIFTTYNNDVDKAIEELKNVNVILIDDGDGTWMTEKGEVGISPDMKDGKTIINATMSIPLKFIPHGNAHNKILNELGFSAEESYWENMGQDTKSCMIKCSDKLVNTTISIIKNKAIIMLLYNF